MSDPVYNVDIAGSNNSLIVSSSNGSINSSLETSGLLTKVNTKLSSLPSDPTINEASSKLLQTGVSLETNVLVYGDSKIDKQILNSFVSNGTISIELDDLKKSFLSACKEIYSDKEIKQLMRNVA